MLRQYQPTDVIFDYVADEEGSNHVTLKMVGKNTNPVIAKFNMTYVGNQVSLQFMRVLKMSQQDIAYCVNRNEAIFYNPKTRLLYAQKWLRSLGMPVYNQYLYPLEEYGVVYIIQFNCIPEKSLFQILGSTSAGKKLLITYFGGDSQQMAKRVHSVVEVDPNTNFIEHGYNGQYIVTVATVPGDNTARRAFVITYPDGPFFYVDNVAKDTSYSI